MNGSRPRRRPFTGAEREAIWQQWRSGTSLEAISAELRLSSSGIYGEIRSHGGIAPAPRRRNPRALQHLERQLLERWHASGISMREIARRLKRSASTISRELHRNGGRTAASRRYDAEVADARACARRRRPKRCALAERPMLRSVVAEKLVADWSPAQISAWLRRHYPEDPAMQISAETIYRSLYVQARGVLRKELVAHLRRGQSIRRSRGRTASGRTGAIIDGVSIAERPADVEDRAIPGHWEGDLLSGTQTSHIATLVERSSRFVVLVRLPGKDSSRVVDALITAAHKLPGGLMGSLTWDRGAELAQHKRFTVATDVQVYFCDPHSPWQRGTNENTNGLLRQYFPKGKDLSDVTQEELDAVALKLNTRPRQTLGWDTPAATLDRLLNSVALTG